MFRISVIGKLKCSSLRVDRRLWKPAMLLYHTSPDCLSERGWLINIMGCHYYLLILKKSKLNRPKHECNKLFRASCETWCPVVHCHPNPSHTQRRPKGALSSNPWARGWNLLGHWTWTAAHADREGQHPWSLSISLGKRCQPALLLGHLDPFHAAWAQALEILVYLSHEFLPISFII